MTRKCLFNAMSPLLNQEDQFVYIEYSPKILISTKSALISVHITGPNLEFCLVNCIKSVG